MLDEKKIRLMCRMAAYEKKGAREDIKISTYFKKDYASLNTWISLLWVTLGYIAAAGLFALCAMDALLENLDFTKLFLLLAAAVITWLFLMVVYGVGASGYYKNKHNRARLRVKRYYRDLTRLKKLAMKENG